MWTSSPDELTEIRSPLTALIGSETMNVAPFPSPSLWARMVPPLRLYQMLDDGEPQPQPTMLSGVDPFSQATYCYYKEFRRPTAPLANASGNVLIASSRPN